MSGRFLLGIRCRKVLIDICVSVAYRLRELMKVGTPGGLEKLIYPQLFHQRSSITHGAMLKVLCGNVGILADQFITLKIGQAGLKNIQQSVMQMLDPGFLDWIRISQAERGTNAVNVAVRNLNLPPGPPGNNGVNAIIAGSALWIPGASLNSLTQILTAIQSTLFTSTFELLHCALTTGSKSCETF